MTGAGVPEAPVQPEIHCKSPHNAVVSWNEPNNNGAVIAEYRLEWQPKENLDFVPVSLHICDLKCFGIRDF